MIIIFNVDVFCGVRLLILGPLGAWVSSFVLYGFGKLIDNSDIIVKSIKFKDGGNSSYQKRNNNINKFVDNSNKLASIFLEAKKKIDIYGKVDYVLLQNKYPTWVREIGNYSLQQLSYIFENESENWEEDYIV